MLILPSSGCMFPFKVDTEMLVLVQRERIRPDKTLSILIACLLDITGISDKVYHFQEFKDLGNCIACKLLK